MKISVEKSFDGLATNLCLTSTKLLLINGHLWWAALPSIVARPKAELRTSAILVQGTECDHQGWCWLKGDRDNNLVENSSKFNFEKEEYLKSWSILSYSTGEKHILAKWRDYNLTKRIIEKVMKCVILNLWSIFDFSIFIVTNKSPKHHFFVFQ